jgi:hypothetical protein
MSTDLLDHDNVMKWVASIKRLLTSRRSRWLACLSALLVVIVFAGYFYMKYKANLPYKEVADGLRSENSRLVGLLKDTDATRAQLAVAQAKLESIQRRFGNCEFFDIKKLSVRKSDVKSLPANAHYFEGDFFYAPTNNVGWAYSQVAPTQFIKFITGQEVSGDVEKMLENASLHIWRSECLHNVSHSSLVSNLVAFVCLTKLNLDDIKDSMGLDVNAVKIADYKNAFQGDVVGVMLATELNSLFLSTSMIADIRAELVTVQKLDNVLYSQSRFTLKNAEVDGRKFKEYYVYLDEMLISLPPSIYVIVAVVPTSEPAPRGPDFNRINEWYTQLAILADP